MSDKLEIVNAGEQAGVPVLHLRGRINAQGAQDLRDQCNALRENGHANLVLDLDGVSFVASSGLGIFLLLTEEYRSAGGRLVLAAPQGGVVQVLQLLNLDQFLEIAPSLDSGCGRFSVSK